VGYWDSRSTAAQLFADPGALERLGLRSETPSEYFAGEWSERNRFNVPGPFYGAETDTCCCGPLEAPDNVLIDDIGMEFIWRQPRGLARLQRVLSAAWCDPFCGYGWDGDAHWTLQAVREWWAGRGEVSEWIDLQLRNNRLVSSAYDYEQAALASLRQFRACFDNSLETDLRQYLFWLEEHRSATDGEPLPLLAR
jgi:hypothetical protein